MRGWLTFLGKLHGLLHPFDHEIRVTDIVVIFQTQDIATILHILRQSLSFLIGHTGELDGHQTFKGVFFDISIFFNGTVGVNVIAARF